MYKDFQDEWKMTQITVLDSGAVVILFFDF